MSRLWPSGIVGRTILVLLVALVGSHIIGMAFYAGDRLSAVTGVRDEQIAERIATGVALAAQLPEQDRRHFASGMRGPRLRSFYSAAPPPLTDEIGNNGIIAGVQKFLGGIDRSRIRMGYTTAEQIDALGGNDRDSERPSRRGWGMHMGGRDRPMMMRDDYHKSDFEGRWIQTSVQVEPGGGWLSFAVPMRRPPPIWNAPFFLQTALTTIVVILLAVLAVRYAVSPLALFTKAAERFGRDVGAPPMREDGPVEVRRAAHAFNRMQERLRTFIDDRTRMLAAISHDLRTPITRLRLRAEFVEDSEQRQKLLNDLDEMEGMIAATLSFARDDAANERHVAVDLAALLESICADAEEAGGEAAYDGPGRCHVHAGPVALKRAFGNLVGNGLKYGHRVRVGLARSAESVVVTVDDDGPGIAEAEHERVFRPFFRLEASRNRETGGVGLGLAVARSIVRAHGGDITLTNRPEGGLRVTVELPAD